MCIRILFSCFLIACLSCSSTQGAPEPDAILKKAIEAHGGVKNIKKPRMGILKGVSKDNDAEVTQEETFDLPKRWKRVTVLSFEGKKRTSFLLEVEGKHWEWEDGGEVRQTKNEQMAVSHFGLLTKMVELTDEKVILSALPEIMIDGQAAIGFTAKFEAGKGHYYFDRNTGLLLQAIFNWQPEPGKVLQAKSVFGDYKEIDGVKLPYRRTYFLKGGDFMDFFQIAEILIKDVRILDRLPNSVFAIPRTNQNLPVGILNEDEKKLQGTWSIVEAKLNGEKQPLPKQGQQMIIKDRRFKTEMGGKVIDEGTFTIDPSAKPKAIDISHSGAEFQGKKGLGIYELKNNELWLAIATAGDDKRPTDFSCEKGKDQALMVFKKSSE